MKTKSNWKAPETAALAGRNSDPPEAFANRARKNISRNCLPTGAERWKHERWVSSSADQVYFSVHFLFSIVLQNSPKRLIVPKRWWTPGGSLSCYDGGQRISKGRIAFQSMFFYSSRCPYINKRSGNFESSCVVRFALATFYTIMINDLLITTTDTYWYLCFALFNILLLLSFAVTNNDSFAIVIIKDQFLFYLVCVCKYENRFASIWFVCVFFFCFTTIQ